MITRTPSLLTLGIDLPTFHNTSKFFEVTFNGVYFSELHKMKIRVIVNAGICILEMRISILAKTRLG